MPLIRGGWADRFKLPPIGIREKREIEEQPEAEPPIKPTPVITPASPEQTQIAQSVLASSDIMRSLAQVDQERSLGAQAAQDLLGIEQARARQAQESRMGEMIDAFKPTKPSTDFIRQASENILASGRQITGGEIFEHARELEGQFRAARFGSDFARLPPNEQAAFGPMSAGLIKEGLEPEEYQQIISLSRNNSPQLFNIPAVKRKAANRVLRSTPTDQPSMTQYIHEDEELDPKRAQQWMTETRQEASAFASRFGIPLERAYDFLSREDPDFATKMSQTFAVGEQQLRETETGRIPGKAGFIKEIGREFDPSGFKDIAAGTGKIFLDLGESLAHVFSKPSQVPSDIKDIGGDIAQIFEGEQKILAPQIRVLTREAMEAVGVPRNVSEPASSLLGEVLVPSTLAPGSRLSLLGKLSKVKALRKADPIFQQMTRLLGLGLEEGAINTLQFHAGAKERGEEPPGPVASAIAFVAGFGGRVGFESLPDAIKALRGKDVRGASIAAQKEVAAAAQIEARTGIPTGARPDVEQAGTRLVPEAERGPLGEVLEPVERGVEEPLGRIAAEAPEPSAPKVEEPVRKGRPRLRKGDQVEFTDANGKKIKGSYQGGVEGQTSLRRVQVPGRRKETLVPFRNIKRVEEAIEEAAVPARAPETPGLPPEELERLQAQARSRLPEGRLHIPRGSKSAGLIPNPTRPRAVAIEKFNGFLNAAKRLKPEQRGIAREILEEQVAKARAASAAAKPGERAAAIAGALKGKRALPTFEGIGGKFTPDEMIELKEAIHSAYWNRPLSEISALDAFDKVMDGFPPSASEFNLLRRVFGDQTAKAMADMRSLPRKVFDETLEIANIPRAMLTSFADASALLRQGLLATAFPKEYIPAGGRYLRFLFDPKFRKTYANKIVDDALYETALDRYKLPIGEAERIAGRGPGEAAGEALEETLFIQRENTFTGRLLSNLPVIKATSESYGLFLADLRLQLFKTHRANMIAAKFDDDAIQTMANFIARATGRGTLGPVESLAPLLNQVFFAARLQAARIQSPGYLLQLASESPGRRYVGRMAAQSLVGSLGSMMGLIQLLNLAPDVSVEMDLRSSDAFKLKIGNTRIDMWGGYQPMARLVAQIAAGVAAGKPLTAVKKTAVGELRDIELFNALGNFVRTKLSPISGAGVDLFMGETFTGKKLRWDPTTVRTEFYNRMIPLFVQDIVDAVVEGGLSSAILAVPGAIGGGVQSYESSSVIVKKLIEDDLQRGIIDPEDYENPPKSQGDLHPADRYAFDLRNAAPLADVEAQYASLGQSPLAQQFDDVVEARSELVGQIELAASLVDEQNPTSTADFATTVKNIKAQLLGQNVLRQFLFESTGIERDERPTIPGIGQDLFDYFATFDRFPNAAGDPNERERMFEALETFTSSLSPERADELTRNLSPDLLAIPLVAELTADNRRLREAGWWAIRDEAWEEIQARAPAELGLDSMQDIAAYLTDLYERTRDALEEKYGYASPELIQAIAFTGKSSDPVNRAYENRVRGMREVWTESTPGLISVLAKWGHNPFGKRDVEILGGGTTSPLGELSPLRELSDLR